MTSHIANLIQKIEGDNRIAFTKRFPYLLAPVLEMKRLRNTLNYTYKKEFRSTTKSLTSSQTWFNLAEHSSPLYRKYSSQDLDKNKIHNIALAIQKLNGIIIEPGQIFSFWKHVGRTSKVKGYKKGLVISDGKLQEDYGGGLCQLSNLLAYMFACTDCTFIERKHHSRDVFPDNGRTVPFASGATIFYNLIDLKVKNTSKQSIRIVLHLTETQLRGSLSTPKKIPYTISLREKYSGFYKSRKTGEVYRFNRLYRVRYAKGPPLKEIIDETLLFENLAKVIYPESAIREDITIV
jgi:vancomycin resistance protein VanW